MRRPIGEDDLHAWADDRLPPERRAEVDAWLAEDPSRAVRVQAWRDDAERLRRTYDDVLDEPCRPDSGASAKCTAAHVSSASPQSSRGSRSGR